MNKIEKIIDHNLEVAHKFTLPEVALFEIYLFVAGIIIAVIFPQVLEVSPWIYGIFVIIGTIYMIRTYFSKNKNLKKRFAKKGWHIHLTKHFGFLDFAIYKITVLLFGIFIIQLFPPLGDIHLAWYVLIFGFGMGYFIKSIGKK